MRDVAPGLAVIDAELDLLDAAVAGEGPAPDRRRPVNGERLDEAIAAARTQRGAKMSERVGITKFGPQPCCS